jgi:hypothetical protein
MVRYSRITLVLALCLTACGGGTAAAIGTAAAAARPSQTQSIVLTSGPLAVTLTSPADETVINNPQVDVVGLAPADTVITINDAITVVEASGQFSVSVPLQEGPNELDVVASDRAGNQASSKLIVTYEPPG